MPGKRGGAALLRPGLQLGPYEVLAPVGAGGMGEVWRGRDTRLGRAVAIKALPGAAAFDVDRRARFEREARAVARLSHPHICALYDVGRQESADGAFDYMVMELVEGESLADVLKRGPLPLARALRHAVEIADALDKAHHEGVVHRDLKPANVMITKTGARLLDFGLARLAREGADAATLSSAPTEAPLTGEGTILGTLAYMAPEQLEGRGADARSDLFAFGAVLHEMVSGRRAFAGRSQASLIAAILKGEVPAVSSLAPIAPPALDRLVSTCLAKDPDERWQIARDVARELRWIAQPAAERSARAHARGLGFWLPWALAGALALAAGFLLATRSRSTGEGAETPARAAAARFDVSAPAGTVFCPIGRDAGPVALSPDGTLAFVATGPDGARPIFVRRLDDPTPRPLSGTEGASYPFWSADGRHIAFFSDGKLRRVEAAGGATQTICDAPLGRGGAWSRDGVILFSPSVYAPLHRVSSTGGRSEPVTRLDAGAGQVSHRWPQFLPDGRRFLFFAFGAVAGAAAGASNGVYLGSLDSPDTRLVLAGGARAEYAPPGHLLFAREGALLAAPFDVRAATVTGEPLPVAQGIQVYVNTGSQAFSVSPSGVLAWHREGLTRVSELVWFDRTGKRLGALGPPGDYEDPALSPDGTRVAFSRIEFGSGAASIWLADTVRGTATRFSFSNSFEHAPVWSPDGTRLAFDTNRNGPTDVYQKALRGGGEELPVIRSPAAELPSDWSREGYIVFQRFDPETRFDIWMRALAGGEPEVALRRSEANELGGRLSPDGRFLAYASDESGRFEVYVSEFPAPGNRFQVSAEGGSQPRWRRDGRELFYLSRRRELMAVELRMEEASPVGPPRALFRTGSRWTAFFLSSYDVTPDGQRFLVNSTLISDDPPPISVALDWPRLLAR